MLQRLRDLYDKTVLPYLLDQVCGLPPFAAQRRKLVPKARGRVLEIGIGTGLNLAHYDASQVAGITGLDPGTELNRLARRRARRSGLKVEMVGLSAERIPFDDASFDTVLVTYSLCTIPDPRAALAEMRRVLKPRGRLVYCEHGLAPDAGVRRWQRRLTPAWSQIAGGCHLDRDIPALLAAAGFRSKDSERGYLRGPRFLMYNYWGTATVAPAAKRG